MIPKIIHYCWFGKGKIPEQQQHYIDDWKRKCPDWEIKLWNETNFDISQHPFVASAYKKNKFAFVSDYVRVWALHHQGGIYLDTDVELKQSLDCFLQHEAFSCIETKGIAFTSAVWGSAIGHSLTRRMLEYYDSRLYEEKEPPNTITITGMLEEHYSIDSEIDQNQLGQDEANSIQIYASHYFCLDLPANYATHHFIGSWTDTSKSESYKDRVHKKYYSENFIDHSTINDNIFLKKIASEITLKKLFHLIRYFIKFKFK